MEPQTHQLNPLGLRKMVDITGLPSQVPSETALRYGDCLMYRKTTWDSTGGPCGFQAFITFGSRRQISGGFGARRKTTTAGRRSFSVRAGVTGLEERS